MQSPRPHSDLQKGKVLMTGTQLTLEKFCSKTAVPAFESQESTPVAPCHLQKEGCRLLR